MGVPSERAGYRVGVQRADDHDASRRETRKKRAVEPGRMDTGPAGPEREQTGRSSAIEQIGDPRAVRGRPTADTTARGRGVRSGELQPASVNRRGAASQPPTSAARPTLPIHGWIHVGPDLPGEPAAQNATAAPGSAHAFIP